MNDLQIHIYHRLNSKELEDGWKKLERQDNTLSPFLYYDYIKYIFKYTALWNVMYSPIIVCVSQNESIKMIAPLKKNRYNNKIMMLGEIQGCGTTDFIYDKTLSQEETFECMLL